MDENFAGEVIKNSMELWFTPEIERRRKDGKIKDNFVLYGAQVILNVGSKNQIRLNEEIKIGASVKVKRAIEKGEHLSLNDISEIEGLHLTDEDPDSGHLTMLLLGNKWILSFDFRYNQSIVKKHSIIAKQFLEASEFSLKNKNYFSFIDNLFSATELIAKGILLLIPDENILTSKKHNYIHKKYNWWGNLGNTDKSYVELLNTLANLRSSARYLNGELSLSKEQMNQMLITANKMYADLSKQIPKRIETKSNN